MSFSSIMLTKLEIFDEVEKIRKEQGDAAAEKHRRESLKANAEGFLFIPKAILNALGIINVIKKL